MGILNIREAVRAGSRVVIGIAGPSGSGKTYTALKIARGMVNHPREIGFLDTENRRGSLYADILDGKFLIGDLYAPFSPARYRQAIEEFQAAGVKVLVVDSVSHEWEGDGGCEEIAQSGGKMANWKLAKSEHKKFMSALLQSDMHIIACLRAREKVDFKNPRDPVSLGMQPICEKNFMFEMTASMMMWNSGQTQQFLKMPSDLVTVFGDGNGYLNETHGKALIEWVNRGEVVDQEFEQWRSRLQMACDGGMASLNKAAEALPEHIKPKMRAVWGQLKASAEEFDNIRKAGESAQPEVSAQPTLTQNFNPAKLQKPEPQQQPEVKADPSEPQPLDGF